jgi:predicted AAA+ superfamily ATPase
MYTRLFPPPERSFFLLGPRATGKSTWLRQNFSNAYWVDLLDPKTFFRLQRAPELLQQELAALTRRQWVVLDEIQKLPVLLDTVQAFLSAEKKRLAFALSGSSARRLKTGGGNLLAGRALTKQFFPLVRKEYGAEFSLDEVLRFGTLPEILSEQRPQLKRELLQAYAATYLREEIQADAVVRKLDPFSRFLEVAAICNGQQVNMSNIARDSGAARKSVQAYFSVLQDTLIGFFLPVWQPRLRIKESTHPKFYLFDCGVVRALSDRLDEPLDSGEKGFLLETYLLHELRFWNQAHRIDGSFSYWKTPTAEVDIVWRKGPRRVAFEIKAQKRWRQESGVHLAEMKAKKIVRDAFGIYLGEKTIKVDDIFVFPVIEFLKKLEHGDLNP